jgi:hypothetical protein
MESMLPTCLPLRFTCPLDLIIIVLDNVTTDDVDRSPLDICGWRRTGHSLGRPMSSSGCLSADMMMDYEDDDGWGYYKHSTHTHVNVGTYHI